MPTSRASFSQWRVFGICPFWIAFAYGHETLSTRQICINELLSKRHCLSIQNTPKNSPERPIMLSQSSSQYLKVWACDFSRLLTLAKACYFFLRSRLTLGSLVRLLLRRPNLVIS